MAGESLSDRIVEQAAHIDVAMQRLLADIREFDASEVWASEGMKSCAHWLSWRVGWAWRWRFRDRTGTVVTAVAARVVPADLGWPAIQARNVGVTMRARSTWDGTPMVYGRVVSHLAFADRRP